jgi:hypothetical protein
MQWIKRRLAEDGTWFVFAIAALADGQPVLEVIIITVAVSLMLHLLAWLALKAQSGSTIDDAM